MSNSAITFNTSGLASATSPGLVGTGAQTFAGAKTFQDGLIPPSSMMFRNKLINGGFDIWQRGTSQTSTGYGSDDRWFNLQAGSTKTASRQTFTLGQTDVPGNPTYFARTVAVLAGSPASSDYVLKSQRVEDVETFAGQTCTFSFWAKADASKNIAVEFGQYFGTGGSPSSSVTGLGVTTCALTTSWQRFSITVTLPSISGKTLGTNNDSYLDVRWWFSAGSDFNARTNSLGNQAGTFDVANAQLESGSIATPFEQRPIQAELNLCQRYYERWQAGDAYGRFCYAVGGGTTSAVIIYNYKVEKRTYLATLSTGGAFQAAVGTFTSMSMSPDGRSSSTAAIDAVGTGWTAFQAFWIRANNNAATFVGFDAEL